MTRLDPTDRALIAALQDGLPLDSDPWPIVAERPDLLFLDVEMPGMDGLALLKRMNLVSPALPVIVMTAFGTVETAVEAMKAGASDYVLKPFSLEDLMITIEKVLELHALRDENVKLKAELGRRYKFEQIIGRGPRGSERKQNGKSGDN